MIDWEDIAYYLRLLQYYSETFQSLVAALKM